MNNYNNKRGGLPLATVIFIVFLALKLSGGVEWSWLWVTAPLWINAIIFLAVFLVAIAYCVVNPTEEENLGLDAD